MKHSETLAKVKKDIRELGNRLDEYSSQLGGVYYDSRTASDDRDILNELDDLNRRIPEIKEKMKALQSYNLSITEAKESIKVCNAKIKELADKFNSLYEKIGVELYCFIGEKELAFTNVNSVYYSLKESEAKSEEMENQLYKLENASKKRSIGDMIVKPFKIRSLKADIKKHNKGSLLKFRELGKIYCDTPQLIDEESNESLLDILDEYKTLTGQLKGQEDRLRNLNNQIKENEERIKEGSNGVKLKTLYSKLEQNIVDIQNQITDKLKVLGHEIAKDESLDTLGEDVWEKLKLYREVEEEISKKKEEVIYLEKCIELEKLNSEIKEKNKRIEIEEEHITKAQEKLDNHKSDLQSLNSKTEELKEWLKAKASDGEV